METIKVTGIVYRYVDYKEYDRIITIISEHGRFDAIARSARKQGGHLCSAAQLFNYGEFVLSKRGNKFSVVQFEMKQSFFELSADYKKFHAASQCLAIAGDTMTKYSQELFYLVYYVISVFCFGDCQAEDTLLCFMIKSLAIHGFTLASTTCALCGASTYTNGAFNSFYGALCSNCAKIKGGKPITPLSLLAIKKIEDLDAKLINNVKLPENVRKELIDSIGRYYMMHMEREIIFL